MVPTILTPHRLPEQMDADAAAAQTEISQLKETIEEYKRECAATKSDMATLKVSILILLV
jgi:hypothetical protein